MSTPLPSSAAGHAKAASAAPAIPAPAVDPSVAAALGARLRSSGMKRLLHSRRPISERDDEADLKRARIPPVFAGATSLDLVSKGKPGGQAAKRKYLLHMPFQFSCKATHEQIGTIAHMNTRNPIMYLQFPTGCIKLFGTLIHTSNTYLAVQYSTSKKAATLPLQVKGTFDRILAFTEWRWIGLVADNPDEKELPVPDDLTVVPRKHASLPMGGTEPQSSGSQQDGEDATMEGEGATPSKQRKKREVKVRRIGAGSSEDEDDEEDDDEPVLDDEDSDEPTSTPRKRKSSAAAASASKTSGSSSKKKRRVASSESDDSSVEEMDGSDTDVAPSQSSSTIARPRRASTNKISYAEKIEDEEEEEESEQEEEAEEAESAAGEEQEDTTAANKTEGEEEEEEEEVQHSDDEVAPSSVQDDSD